VTTVIDTFSLSDLTIFPLKGEIKNAILLLQTVNQIVAIQWQTEEANHCRYVINPRL